MANLNFPAGAAVGALYTPPNGRVYEYNGDNYWSIKPSADGGGDGGLTPGDIPGYDWVPNVEGRICIIETMSNAQRDDIDKMSAHNSYGMATRAETGLSERGRGPYDIIAAPSGILGPNTNNLLYNKNTAPSSWEGLYFFKNGAVVSSDLYWGQGAQDTMTPTNFQYPRVFKGQVFVDYSSRISGSRFSGYQWLKFYDVFEAPNLKHILGSFTLMDGSFSQGTCYWKWDTPLLESFPRTATIAAAVGDKKGTPSHTGDANGENNNFAMRCNVPMLDDENLSNFVYSFRPILKNRVDLSFTTRAGATLTSEAQAHLDRLKAHPNVQMESTSTI